MSKAVVSGTYTFLGAVAGTVVAIVLANIAIGIIKSISHVFSQQAKPITNATILTIKRK